jgi:hypothetical protein
MRTTVCAVMRVTVEIPVRSSSAEETCAQLFEASLREAETLLRTKLPSDFLVVGKPEFAYATIKETK